MTKRLSQVDVYKVPTSPPKGIEKKKISVKTQKYLKRIGLLQSALFAEKKQALLVILQGMDASGKDSTISTIFAACSQSGIRVHAFKTPTEEENAHDFLWRTHQLTPEKGIIQVFNRSYYEYVLIQRVHKQISKNRVKSRIQAINSFEELLEFDSKTKVLKLF